MNKINSDPFCNRKDHGKDPNGSKWYQFGEAEIYTPTLTRYYNQEVTLMQPVWYTVIVQFFWMFYSQYPRQISLWLTLRL